MTRPRIDYLSAAEKDALHQRVLHILATVGVGVRSERALGLLAEAGAQVDGTRQIAKIPPELVEACLETTPRSVRLAARNPANDLVVGAGSPLACTTDGEGSQVMDDNTAAVREATRDDLAYFYGLFDALPEIDYVWTSLTANDLDPVTGGLENDLTAFESTSKHVQSVVAHSPERLPALLEMLHAIAGASLHERPIYSSVHAPVSPLQFEGDKLDVSLELARQGVPILIYPLPLMGTTAPMSVPGTAVVTIAEFLAGVVMFQVAAPGCALMVTGAAGASDLRTGGFLTGAPEVALFNMTCLAMSTHYGLPSMGVGISSDAKDVNYQAGAEGVMTAMAAVLSGADILVSAGFLDGVRVISTAKLILDCDSIGALRRLLAPTAIDDTTVLLRDIEEVGPGGNFLGRRSSREGSRQGGIWRPWAFQRGNHSDFGRRSLVTDALERARTILDAHSPTPMPDDVRRAARGAIGQAPHAVDSVIR